MGMTMNREMKARHTGQLITAAAHGYTSTRFESPTLAIKARADRGHHYMTAQEYLTHRMDRGRMDVSRLALKIETRGLIHRMQRIIGGRRITGLVPGTKKPITPSPAERKITRK